MLDRRALLIAAIGSLVATDQTLAFFHREKKRKKKVAKKKAAPPFRLDPKYEPQRVTYGDGNYPPNSIVIDPEGRFLYYMEDETSATRS